jgi:acylphosphatase
MGKMNQQRWEVWYGGHVQGVGFRYTVCSIARGFEVSGYVRNLPDGRVHLVAEGDASELKAFLDEVEYKMAHFIRDVRKDNTGATGEFAAFEVRH